MIPKGLLEPKAFYDSVTGETQKGQVKNCLQRCFSLYSTQESKQCVPVARCGFSCGKQGAWCQPVRVPMCLSAAPVCSQPCPDPLAGPPLAAHQCWLRVCSCAGLLARGREGGGGCLLFSSGVTLGFRVKENLAGRFSSQANEELQSCSSALITGGSDRSSSDILGIS